jgi:plasmid stabilization system protein ParE
MRAALAPRGRSFASSSVPTKYRVEITKTAESDIHEIWNYIEGDSPADAAQFVKRLEDTIGTLERFPLRCHAIPENALLGTDYRHLVLDPYRIIFRIAGRTIFVLRVVHGGRLLDSSPFNE